MKKTHKFKKVYGDYFRETFVKNIKKCFWKKKEESTQKWLESLNVNISKATFSSWYTGVHIPALSSCEKFLTAMPKLKIKVTNKLTKEEMFFDSFRDVILLVRKEYKLKYGKFIEALRTEEILKNNVRTKTNLNGLLNIKQATIINGFDSIAIFLETLGLEGEIVLLD